MARCLADARVGVDRLFGSAMMYKLLLKKELFYFSIEPDLWLCWG